MAEERGDEVNRGGVAGVGFIVPGGDAAEFFDQLKEIRDQVTPFGHLAVVRDRRFAVGLRRDDGGGAAIVQGGAQGVVVERLLRTPRNPGRPSWLFRINLMSISSSTKCL